MTRETITTHAILLLVIFSYSCRTVPEQPIVEKDGRRCGEVAGTFSGRWWNYFERGQSYAGCQLWEAAAKDYRKAIAQRLDDNSRARTYGMNFVEYFPHRELGISLYHRHLYEEAISELETSLAHETSAKAQFYLDRARKAWILFHNLDRADPEIRLSSDVDPGPTNAFTLGIEGSAVDDTYVKRIRLNGRDLTIDLGAAEIPFSAGIPLYPGSNRIQIEVQDICGNWTELVKRITCDRSGPILNIGSIECPKTENPSCWIKGYASDSSGIRSIRINGQTLTITGGKDVDFQYPCYPAGAVSEIVVAAEDGAGNVTTAVVDKQLLESGPKGRRGAPLLLAVNGPMPLHLLDPKPSNPLLVDLEAPQNAPAPCPSYPATAPSRREDALHIDMGASAGIHGRNYALIVGINNYKAWPQLKTAVNDASQLASVLESRYGFAKRDITLLLDQKATKAAILDALMAITAAMGEQDNLLVYFAGHGIDYPLTYDGYWIPVAGQRKDAIWTWIAHSAVRNLISSGTVRGKNIIVVTDSCYGGRLSRGGQSGDLAQHALTPSKVLALATRKSRQIISSGSLEQVADWGEDGHSLFAYYLLRALKQNREKYVCLSSLVITKVWEPVNRISRQRPVIRRFNTPMDEDGEFVLHLVAKQDTAMALTAPEPPSDQGSRRAQADDIEDVTPPAIVLESWETQQTVFLESAFLSGHVFDQGGIAVIRLNGRSILKRPGMKVYFNELARLSLGDNPFVIETWDSAGNRSRKQIHIYRKQPEVETPVARMSAVMLPFETVGKSVLDIQGALFDYLDDSRRFNLKYWKDHINASTNAVQATALDARLTRRLKAQGIDCTLSGRIQMRGHALDIRTRVVALEDRTVLAKANVYGEDLDREKIRTMCRGLVNKIRRDLPVVEGQIAGIRGNKIVINRGGRHGLKNGLPLILFEEEKITDPGTGQSLGIDRYPTAMARIDNVQEKLSHAVLIGESQGDIAVGQKVITK
jgi:hypothetical protein